jgi:hypothetical protein
MILGNPGIDPSRQELDMPSWRRGFSCATCQYAAFSPAMRSLPISKPDSIMAGPTAKKEDNRQEQKAYNGNDLDAGKHKLCLSIPFDNCNPVRQLTHSGLLIHNICTKDVEQEYDGKDDDDPYCFIDLLSPILA